MLQKLIWIIVWPVGLWLNWLLVYILLYGLGRTGVYTTCPSMIELPTQFTPLLTANPCLQRWFALTFLWAGITVGHGIGFVQWWFMLRQLNLPKTWIDIHTISWAVGGPVAYLLYVALFRKHPFQFLPFQAEAQPELIMFTWVLLMSEFISFVGGQWQLRWYQRLKTVEPAATTVFKVTIG